MAVSQLLQIQTREGTGEIKLLVGILLVLLVCLGLVYISLKKPLDGRHLHSRIGGSGETEPVRGSRAYENELERAGGTRIETTAEGEEEL